MIRALLILSLIFGQSISGPAKISGPVTVPAPSTIAPIALTGKTCIAESDFGNPTCTWSTAPSIGETIYCAVANQNFGGGTPFSVTDNASTPNTYTGNGSAFTSSNTLVTHQFFASFSILHSPTTTTFSDTGANQNHMEMVCFSVTGGVGAVDGSVGTLDQASGTSASVTVVPTGSVDIAIGAAHGSNNTTVWTQGSGYTQIGATSCTNCNLNVEAKILSASGSQSVPYSYTPSGVASMIGATYK
jgi:hypothetical protein